jgi:hypothetical protein
MYVSMFTGITSGTLLNANYVRMCCLCVIWRNARMHCMNTVHAECGRERYVYMVRVRICNIALMYAGMCCKWQSRICDVYGNARLYGIYL